MREITMYETSDGNVSRTRKTAEQHETFLVLSNALFDLPEAPGQSPNVEAALKALAKHYEVTLTRRPS